jgi:hypothetical protein
MEREAPPVRLERRQRRGTRDVRYPRPRLNACGNIRNRVVGDANHDQATVGADDDAALAQAGGDGRADAAGTDDGDALEHL